MLVKFGNTGSKNFSDGQIDWTSSEFFSSSYNQIGQHVVLTHLKVGGRLKWPEKKNGHAKFVAIWASHKF